MVTATILKPPLPPFTLETALQKIQAAENTWNTSDPERIALAYTPDSQWRNRSEFISGRDSIAVRFGYEWHDNPGQWHRSYVNGN